MKYLINSPHISKLEKKYVDYLWKIIKKVRNKKKNTNIDLLETSAIVLVL